MKKLVITFLLVICAATTLQALEQRYNPKTGKIEYYAPTSGYMGFMVPQAAD